jgi:hypothetical protein
VYQYVHVIQWKKQSILTSRSASRDRRAESVLESGQARRTRAKLGGLIYGPNGVWFGGVYFAKEIEIGSCR